MKIRYLGVVLENGENNTNLILEPILNSSRSNQCEALLHALVDLPHKLCPEKK